MDWYIVYKGRTTHGTNTLVENLESAAVPYYIPMQVLERLEEGRMVEYTKPILNNLIFIQSDGNITDVIRDIDGLKAPYINCTTRKPATVSDKELQRFRWLLEAHSLQAEYLSDPYRKFEKYPRVRVRAGEFEGLEGRVVRMRKDRKLIISLDNIAIALTGIHHTLLEIIE